MIESLRCVLLPIQKRTMIVPYSVVAEVVPLDKVKPIASAPNWLLGKHVWRDIQIPLIALEKMDNNSKPETEDDKSTNKHIAVLNQIYDTKGVDFISILLQDIPKMSRCKRADIQFFSKSDQNYIEMEVLIREKPALIPNIQWIFEQVAALKSSLPVAGKS